MQLAAVAAPKQIKSFVLSSMVMSSIYFLHIRRMRPSKGYISLQGVEKVTFLRLIKNAQMQGTRNPEECGVLGVRRNDLPC
jgi:hypothetical protein